MNKIFCVACGHKNIYEVTQPKFCASCGAGIGVSGNASSISGRDKVLAPEVEVEYGEEKVGGFDIEKMRRQVIAESSNEKMKLGDIMGSSAGSDDYHREASNLPDGEALLEQTKRECGSAKSSDIDV